MAWAQLSCARLADFDRTIEDIGRHPGHTAPDVILEVRLLKAYRLMSQDDTAASLQLLEPLMESPPPLASALHIQLLSHIASHALAHAHRFEEAREVTRWPRRHRNPARRNQTRPLVEVVEGFSHLLQGNIREAVAVLIPSASQPQGALEWDADAAVVAAGYSAEACYQADEFAIARAFLNQNAEHIDAVGTADSVLYAYRVQARLERLDGDCATALRTLRRLEEIGYQRHLDRLVAWSLYEQHALALATRHGSSPAEIRSRLDGLAQRYRDQRDCAWSEIGLASLLVRADFAFEHAGDACSFVDIDFADSACRALGRQLLSTRLTFMRAVVMLRNGDSEHAALRFGREAVRAASEAGMMRVVADLGEACRPLLMLLLAGSDLLEPERRYVEGALRSVAAGLESESRHSSAHPPVGNDDTATGGILSRREQEVVALLSKALSTKSIARMLNISSGTAKWHLKNIYSKLNAGSREDALAKARKLGVVR